MQGEFSHRCSISSRGERIPSTSVLQGSLPVFQSYLGLAFIPMVQSLLSNDNMAFLAPFLWMLVAYVPIYMTSRRASPKVKSTHVLYANLNAHYTARSSVIHASIIAIMAIPVRNRPEVQKQEIAIERNMLSIHTFLLI